MLKIVAQVVVRNQDGWTTSVGVPTFYLDCPLDSTALRRLIREVVDPLGKVASIHAGILDESTTEYRSLDILCSTSS